MVYSQHIQAEEKIRFDILRVIRLTALSFVFVALLSVYGGSTEPSAPAAASGAASGPTSQTLLSES